MDSEALKERFLPVVREHWLALVLGFVGISFMGYGLIQLLVTRGDSSEITFQSGGKSTEVQERKGTGVIVVDVEGAVLKPGVYKLPVDSRVQDALIAAGGMSEHADRQKVAKGMNLAAKVIDGGKVYIPFTGESSSGGSTADALLGAKTGGLVNINTASETELDSLPGVGPSTAQKIISSRPYSSVEDLMSKKVVGKSAFEKIKENIVVQ